MKARQDSLGQHPIGRHALVATIVIAGCDDDLQIEPWKDIKSLATIAERGDPALLARSVRAVEHHFAEIPVTAIFAPVAYRHLRLERFFQPVGGNDLPLAGLAAREDHLSDTRQIAGPHADAGGEVSLAVRADAPYGRSDPERIEQNLTCIVRQCLFGAVLQNLPDQRGGAATINPPRARCRDNRQPQHMTIGVGRPVHRGLPVARIVVGNILIPFDAKRHADRMPDRPAAALLQVLKVGVIRELCKQRRIERRHLALAERDAVQQANDALAHGAQLVAALGRERDTFKMRSAVFVPHLIVALEIVLEDHPAPPDDDDAVDVRGLPAANELIELLAEAGDESCIGGRYRLPLVWRRGARQRGIAGKRSGSDQKFAAIEHGALPATGSKPSLSVRLSQGRETLIFARTTSPDARQARCFSRAAIRSRIAFDIGTGRWVCWLVLTQTISPVTSASLPPFRKIASSKVRLELPIRA